MANLKVTQQTIADALNISRTTVSKVFRHKPVSEKVRDEILKKALELGYIDDAGGLTGAKSLPGDYYQRMKRILESMSDAFYAVDSSWRILYINHIAEELWGKKREELIGRKIWEIFSEYRNIFGSQELRIAMDEKREIAFETYSPYLKTHIQVDVFPSETGGLDIFFRDVTSKRHIEEMLRTSDQLLHLAIDVSGMGFWRYDVTLDRFSPIYVSPGIPAYWHMGSLNEGLLSVHLEDRDRVLSEFMSAARDERDYKCEYRRVMPGGKVLWICSEAKFMTNSVEGSSYLIGVNYDITEIKMSLLRGKSFE